ncbi:MAG TPA: AI-2E family transporter [Kofleriaceae bacterium]|nr:AI-2E family transporter [Kofleriaceae bacterium]
MIILLAALKVAAPVVVPLLLAVCVAVAFQPVTSRLARRGLSPYIAAAATALAIVSVLALVSGLLIASVAELTESLPQHDAQLRVARADIASWLDGRSLADLGNWVRRADLGQVSQSVVGASVLMAGSALATTGMVLLFTLFIQLEAPTFPRKLRRILHDESSYQTTADALGEIQKYLLVKIAVSAGKGGLVGLWSLAAGVSYPVLWGVLAFALNFVPVLGSIVAITPIVALALLEHGPAHAAIVAGGAIVIHVVIGYLLEPRVMGRALDLSPLVVVLGLVLWGFVLGPVGALLAVPLTMVVKIVLEHTEGMAWLARVIEYRRPALAGAPAAPPSPAPRRRRRSRPARR